MTTKYIYLFMSSWDTMTRRWLTQCCSCAIELFLWATLSGAVLGTNPLLNTTFWCCSFVPLGAWACLWSVQVLWLWDGGAWPLYFWGVELGGKCLLQPFGLWFVWKWPRPGPPPSSSVFPPPSSCLPLFFTVSWSEQGVDREAVSESSSPLSFLFGAACCFTSMSGSVCRVTVAWSTVTAAFDLGKKNENQNQSFHYCGQTTRVGSSFEIQSIPQAATKWTANDPHPQPIPHRTDFNPL